MDKDSCCQSGPLCLPTLGACLFTFLLTLFPDQLIHCAGRITVGRDKSSFVALGLLNFS